MFAHETREGTYTESTANGVVSVTFVSEEISVTSSIAPDVLTVSKEWWGDHGYGT
ncbi:MAG: hypothetical protein FWF66_03895 [Candidatus Bathyarchaeota archaeon]|nr:hypothetical protein [Candidatus Termiticorpusculum sp.]